VNGRREQALNQQRWTKRQRDYGHPLGNIDWDECRKAKADEQLVVMDSPQQDWQ
jgi:hypothetical protein